MQPKNQLSLRGVLGQPKIDNWEFEERRAMSKYLNSSLGVLKNLGVAVGKKDLEGMDKYSKQLRQLVDNLFFVIQGYVSAKTTKHKEE